ncbi:MAG: hypothetical protein MHM6MM_003105 [Cercozoa sp. M6MM]
MVSPVVVRTTKRTRECYVPDLIVLTQSSHAARLKRRFVSDYFGADVQCEVIEQEMDHRLIFLRMQKRENLETLMERVWSHHTVPRFIHGIYRVDAIVDNAVDNFEQARAALQEANNGVDVFAESNKWRVQARPTNRVMQVAETLYQNGVSLSPSSFDRVFMCARMFDRDYLGVCVAAQWQNKQRSIEREEATRNAVCRAQFKLREVCEDFGIELPSTLRAVDVGAAPGGWTTCLARIAGPGSRVVAIDPAQIDLAEVRRLAANDNATVVHLQQRVQKVLYSEELAQTAPFDIIVCDMNIDPRISCRQVQLLAPQMRPGAVLVLTLKFMNKGLKKLYEHEVRAALSQQFDNVRSRWLMTNGRNETTVVGTRKQLLPETLDDSCFSDLQRHSSSS